MTRNITGGLMSQGVEAMWGAAEQIDHRNDVSFLFGQSSAGEGIHTSRFFKRAQRKQTVAPTPPPPLLSTLSHAARCAAGFRNVEIPTLISDGVEAFMSCCGGELACGGAKSIHACRQVFHLLATRCRSICPKQRVAPGPDEASTFPH